MTPPRDPPPPAVPSEEYGAEIDAELERLEHALDRAVSALHRGRPQQAVRLLRSVRRRAERLGDLRPARVIVGRTLLSESAPRLDMTGRLDEALGLLASAEEVADEVDSATLAATVRGQRALVVLRSGDTRAALAAFDAAAAMIDHATSRDRTIIMLNRGALHLESGQVARAEADLARAVEFAEQVGDPSLALIAQHNLGYVDFLAGRIPRALSRLEQAQRAVAGDPHPVMLLDRARVLREAGLVREADAILDRAAELMRRARLFQDLGETELVRAECAVAGGESKQARALAASAHRRFTRRGNARWCRIAELLLLRCEHADAMAKGDSARPRAFARLAGKAEDLAQLCRRERRTDLARAAELLAAECRLRAGEEPHRVSLVLRAADRLQTRLHVREVRALAALHAQDPTRAAREVRQGLAELGSYQHRFGSLDMRTASAVHGVALATLGLDVAMGTGSPARVLALVEQARAVSTRLPQVRPPRDPLTAELLGSLRQVEEERRELAGEPGAEELRSRLRARTAQLQREIRARAWEVEGGEGRSSAAGSPRLGQVREAARDADTCFVSYARYRGRFIAVTVTGGKPELSDLAGIDSTSALVHRVRADLDALAMPHLPDAVALAVRSSISSGLRRLDELLLAPLRVEGRPLVVSCSGALVVLPWSLLPSRRALPTVVTPSAGSWLRSQLSPSRPAHPSVVSLAGPGLHRAELEAKRVSSTWPGASLLTGSGATTAAAGSALQTADVVHVAAHGTHHQDSPLFSSVRLADGPLYAYELDAASGVSGCVALSACEAGLATLRPGDEGLGLTNVLLHLGARSVVSGVARVRDEVAADVMEKVHLAMAAGADSATALAEALEATSDAPAPAPFVCFGATW